MALEALRELSDKPIPFNQVVTTEPSSVKGTSLDQIYILAKKLPLDLTMARRAPGSAILVPAVINWKVGHFAAIIGKKNGLIHLHDPTFGDDVWISPRALDSEASGYFLVKNQSLPEGWSAVSEDEGKTVWGKGPTQVTDPKRHTCQDGQTGGCSSCGGMATYSIFKAQASLSIKDTPLFYQPAYGPSVNFTITYAQRETYQPSAFTYSNLGPLWTFGWLSYIIDDPTNPGADVTQYVGGGGEYTYTGYNSSTQSYAPQSETGAILKITSSSSYELDMPDGSKQVFGTANTGSQQRNVFLTQYVDLSGFALNYTYDSYYRMQAVQDATGLVTTLAYGSTNSSDPAFYQISSVTDPFNRTATLTYVGGNLASSTDMIGVVSSYGYAGGTLTALTTPYGTTTFDVGEDSDKDWVQVTDPQGGKERVETWHEENTNVPIPSRVPSGASGVISYDVYRNCFYWDKKAMLKDTGGLVYTDAQITHFLHISPSDENTMSGVVESTLSPLEGRVYYFYDGQSVANAVGTSEFPTRIARILSDGSTQETDMTYDGMGHMIQIKDPAGRITKYYYDPANGIDLVKTTQVNGSAEDIISSTTYNSNHQPLTITDASHQTTTYTYNASGPAAGLVSTVTDALGETTTYGYNSSGQLTLITGPVAGSTVAKTYDGYGRLRTQTDINGYVMTYDYDSLNRVTQITYPDGTTDQNVYTNMDRTLSKDRQGRWTRYLYNSVRQVVGVVDPQGRTTNYERCICGELKAIVDPNGNRTSWVKDLEGRTTSKIFADGHHYTYAYDTGYTSRLLSVTDPLSQVTTYSYNPDDTLSQAVYTGTAISTPTVSYGYDGNYQRLTSMSVGSAVTTYHYNNVWASGAPITGGGRLGTETGPLGSTAAITYTYDAIGRITGTSINGVSSSTTYDSLGRVTGVSNPLGSFIYAYYGVTPRLQTLTYPNGQSTSYSYQTDSTQDYRLTNITNYKTGDIVLSKFDYTYNPVGTIATWQQQTDTSTPTLWKCGYDNADQLRSVTETNTSTGAILAQDVYGFDPAGNRTSEQQGFNIRSTTYNSENQIHQILGANTSTTLPLQFNGTLSKPSQVTVAGQPATYGNYYSTNFSGVASVMEGTNTVAVIAHDVNGNTSTNNYQVVIPSGGAVTSPAYDADGNVTNNGAGQAYIWDAKNELVSIVYNAGTNAGNHTEFTYDGMGRRVEIEERLGTSVGSGTLTSAKQYIWVGNTIAEERDASGTTVTKRFFSQGEQQAGISYLYTRDHLGSVRELCDSSGNIQTRYGYDPYGRTTLVSGTNLSDFQYAGYYAHQPSGLNLTLFRAYDPNSARWLSRDPLKDAEMSQGTNLYEYVKNNPIDLVDPFGLYSCQQICAEIKAAEAGLKTAFQMAKQGKSEFQLGATDRGSAGVGGNTQMANDFENSPVNSFFGTVDLIYITAVGAAVAPFAATTPFNINTARGMNEAYRQQQELDWAKGLAKQQGCDCSKCNK